MNEAQLQRLYQRLTRGDVTASARLVDEVLPALVRHLRRRCAAVPVEMVSDAAIDAILVLINQPAKYDATKGELWSYLRRIAENKAADQLRQWYRQASRERPVAAIEEIAERQSLANSQFIGRAGSSGSDSTDLPLEVAALVDSALLSAEERRVFALVCDGTRNLGEYASVLGIMHLPIESQRREVKRVRDRIMKRLARRREEIARLLKEII